MDLHAIAITGDSTDLSLDVAKSLCQSSSRFALLSNAGALCDDLTGLGAKDLVWGTMPTLGQYDRVPVLVLDSCLLEADHCLEEIIPALSLYAQSGSLSSPNSDACIVTARSTDPCKLARLMECLWAERNSSGLLSKRLIKLMIDSGTLLDNAEVGLATGAAYDLSLGDQFYYGGEVRELSTTKPFIRIEPYDYAIIKSQETMRFPRDIAGRFDLPVSLFVRGIVLSNSTQVDPGFRGPLLCLLFNTSNTVVVLKKGQHCATLEFQKLSEPTVRYGGGHRDQDIGHYLPANAIHGGLNDLKMELEDMKRENRMLQTTLVGLMSLTLAVIAALLALR